MSTPEQVSVGGGKYTVQLHADGRLDALRHGDPWQDLTGNKLVYCLAAELQEARDLLKRAGDAIEALDGTNVENEKLVDDYRALMARFK